MNKKVLLLIFQLACVAAYCQPKKIYLSPKAAGGANQSVFIDSLRFYPLEKSQSASLGTYNNLYVSEDYFILGNYTDKVLNFYSKQGKFVHRISYKNLGGDGYPKYDKNKQQISFFMRNKNYVLTQRDMIKVKADFANKKNKKYFKKYVIDLKDSSLTIQRTEVSNFDILDAYNLTGDYYCTYQIHVSKDYKDTLDYEVKIYQNEKLVKAYFPYNKQNEPRYLHSRGSAAITFESGKPDTFYITRPFTDTVYALSNDIVTPMYQVVLPMENGLPKSFFETRFKNTTERDNFERNNGWMLNQIYSMYEANRYTIVTIGFFSNYGVYLYDKKTSTSYNTSKIKADSTTYNLPLIGDFSGERVGSRFYRIVTAEQLKKVYELKDKSAPFPKELQDCFKDPKNPTPLIVEYTIKN
ncbi:6-bladed beta-propeller [Niabella yanshanensis]|uniref:6-bladed beta-propeller n=1 Tax=Niabella yanshanensis TaxID=577386 RepID=A0ABZ0W022_9BACT|nr:6-bladed beta-propeller [Niabella yanshanensis]WQD36421.1 6-bladed beta-propeller [Niabella yanshanensis]